MVKGALLLLMYLLPACNQANETPSYPIVALIMASVDADYQLREVKIDSLTNINTMTGIYGSIKGQAALNLDVQMEEILASTDPSGVYSNRGQAVKTDYLLQNGIVIPQNFQTMEMLGLYYAYQQTLRFWIKNFDLPIEKIGFPQLYFNPKMLSHKNGEQIEVSTTMNAAYLPSVRDFWFFKTAAKERVPVKMNFGIIAHEFAHFAFDYYFAELNRDNYSAKFHLNEFFLSGLNEGLADYLSFVATGSVLEFRASLPTLDAQRRLPVPWTLKSILSSPCSGTFYCEGSVLASSLYEIAQTLDPTGISVAKTVIGALGPFRKEWLLHRDVDYLDYSSLLNPILDAAGNDRASYCLSFKKWFDTENVRLKLACT